MNDCFFKELRREVEKLRLKTKFNAEAIDSVNNKVDLQHYRIEDIKEEINRLSQRQDFLSQYMGNMQRQVEELLESSYERDEDDEEVESTNKQMIDCVNDFIDRCGFSGKIKAVEIDE